MPNYFGKSRLIKIFYHYISDRPEYMQEFTKEVREYGKDIMFDYKKYRGTEWLECHNDGYSFKFYAFGRVNKTLTMDEKKYHEEQDNYLPVKHIVSYYDANFCPYSGNKDKSLDCYDIGKVVKEN